MKNKMPYVFLIIALVSFSAYEVVSKTVVGSINATQLTFIRFLIGGLFLLPFAMKHLRKQHIKLEKKDWLQVCLLGIINVTFSMNLIQIGYKYTNANLSAIIISSNPIFVAMFSTLLLKEKLTVKKILGLIIGVCGVLVAMGATGDFSDPSVRYGIMLQVIGMLAFSLYTVLGKKTALKIGSQSMSAFSDLFGALTILPILFLEGIHPFSFQLSNIWIQMIYICIGNTGIAFYLYFKALEKLDTSLGAMTFFVKPILACVIAAIFLGEALSVQIAIGILLVAIGIYFVLLATQKKNVVVKQVEET